MLLRVPACLSYTMNPALRKAFEKRSEVERILILGEMSESVIEYPKRKYIDYSQKL